MRKFFIIITLFSSLYIMPQEKEDKSVTESIDEERKKILLYGIDQEVKDLLTKLISEKIKGFDKELVKLLESSFDESIKTQIFEYFILMETDIGEDYALKIFDAIEYEDEYTDSYATQAFKYLSNIKSDKAADKISIALESQNDAVLKAGLKFVGENKLIKSEEKLLEMLQDEETEDQIYLEIIKSLGKMQSQKALDILIPIADDEDEETTVRNAVCLSLGEIGNIKAIPVLKRCLSDRKNYLLRKSSLEALGKFNLSEINDILIEALRDPIWQIRYEAIKALANRKVEKSFDILKYKALKDPEDKIKKEAFYAIGDINSNECREFLKEIFTSKDYSDTFKIYSIEKLIEHNVDWIFPTVMDLYKKENMEKRKPVLDKTLDLMSKREYKYGIELWKKMLDHENYVYRILAIQAIKLNKFYELNDKIKDISENDKNNSVKKHALSVIAN